MLKIDIKFKGEGQYKPRSMSAQKWYKVHEIQFSIKVDNNKKRYPVAYFWIVDNNSKLLPVSHMIAEVRKGEIL